MKPPFLPLYRSRVLRVEFILFVLMYIASLPRPLRPALSAPRSPLCPLRPAYRYIIEIPSSVVFLIGLMFRWVGTEHRGWFLFRFDTIIDIVTIIPGFVEAGVINSGSYTGMDTGNRAWLQMLRLLRIFQVRKRRRVVTYCSI